MNPEQAKALRAPFPPSAIGSMPKGGTTLDYVGHAAVTDRLLAVDPDWTWEPMALDDRGLPLIDVRGQQAHLWIKLTVCGVTTLGVGTCQVNEGEVVKVLIGDAIRNAAMRRGVALDLWSKEELHAEAAPPDAGRVAKAPRQERAPKPAKEDVGRPPETGDAPEADTSGAEPGPPIAMRKGRLKATISSLPDDAQDWLRHNWPNNIATLKNAAFNHHDADRLEVVLEQRPWEQPDTEPEPADDKPKQTRQQKALWASARTAGLSTDQVHELASEVLGREIASTNDLRPTEISKVIAAIAGEDAA